MCKSFILLSVVDIYRHDFARTPRSVMKLFLTPLVIWAILSQAVSRYLLVDMDESQGNHTLNNNKMKYLYFSILVKVFSFLIYGKL